MLDENVRCNQSRLQAALLIGMVILGSQMHVAAQEPVAYKFSQPASSPLVEANNSFALELLRTVNAGSEGANQFLSPFSIQSVLTIAMEGARGETASEMGLALQYPKSLKQPGILPRNLETIRQEFKAAGERMTPDDSPEANQLRSQLETLRKELKLANEQVQSLTRSNKYQEANAKSRDASDLSNRISGLAKQVDQYELSNANSLWIDSSFKISPRYQATITDNYRPTIVEAADFRNSANAERLRINQWVNDQTREKIRDIIPPDAVNTMTRLVIANAIYFKGSWVTPFDAHDTKPAPFTSSDKQQHNVALMNLNSFTEGKYAAFNADGTPFKTPQTVAYDFNEKAGYPGKGGYQVAELPYNHDKISMLIFLPSDLDGLDSLLRTLSATQLDTCARSLEQREFHVSLPKFKLESTYDLIPPLESLGMQQAFRERTADFSGLTEVREPDHQLFITAVMHKAFVEVNEQGTEAPAATFAAVGLTSASSQRPFVPRFKADHPFLFVIRERTSGLILFIGTVEKPIA